MGVTAFEGPAGCGKTHRLIDELAATLQTRPLAPHQRVLALTFMHGSRRRLEARLRTVAGLAGRYEATTIDGFARRLTERWARLAQHLGNALPEEKDFAGTCKLAAALLAQATVRNWVDMSFPILLIDEAQDLSQERSSMVAACAPSGTILLAFDEFQCLNPALLPIPIEAWLRNHCKPTVLSGSKRTSNQELIEAAVAVRNGRPIPANGRSFKIFPAPSSSLAATFIANAIAWRSPKSSSVAILTPSRTGGFAENALARVRQGPNGKQKNGPYDVQWEGNDEQELLDLWTRLGIVDGCGIDDAIRQLAQHRNAPPAALLRDWLILRRSAAGVTVVIASELKQQLDRILARRRNFGGQAEPRLRAMSIQQAKNREFDHVVVLWPYTVSGKAEQKRRLLYNAITRARHGCTVLVQNPKMLDTPPFGRPHNRNDKISDFL